MKNNMDNMNMKTALNFSAYVGQWIFQWAQQATKPPYSPPLN